MDAKIDSKIVVAVKMFSQLSTEIFPPFQCPLSCQSTIPSALQSKLSCFVATNSFSMCRHRINIKFQMIEAKNKNIKPQKTLVRRKKL
jgi:hypothetical protein